MTAATYSVLSVEHVTDRLHRAIRLSTKFVIVWCDGQYRLYDRSKMQPPWRAAELYSRYDAVLNYNLCENSDALAAQKARDELREWTRKVELWD